MRLETYSGDDLANLCVKPSHTLQHAMTTMGQRGIRLAPVVSGKGQFSGVIADGDIRRFIASGGTLNDPVEKAMNRTPILRERPGSDADLRQFMLWHGVDHMPHVENGELVALHILWLGSQNENPAAIIMAGGLGSRLAPLTDNCPKPLITVGDKPILTHIIEHLRSQGVTRFILSVRYLAEMVTNHYGDGSALGVSIDYIHETKRMGTGGALGLIAPDLLSDPFVCMNGDILNDIDIEALKKAHSSNNWEATMALCQHSVTIPYGVVHSNQDHAFSHAEEKPTLKFNINAGIYMLSKSVLDLVPQDVFYDLPSLFSDAVKKGHAAGTYVHTGRWIDIGNQSELARARAIYSAEK